MGDKTCGECKYHDKYSCLKLEYNVLIGSEHLACIRFCPKKPTNSDVIRAGGDKALAEISIYEDKLADGVVVYRSTLIEEKHWLTRECAIKYVEWLLNTPSESEVKDE